MKSILQGPVPSLFSQDAKCDTRYRAQCHLHYHLTMITQAFSKKGDRMDAWVHSASHSLCKWRHFRPDALGMLALSRRPAHQGHHGVGHCLISAWSPSTERKPDSHPNSVPYSTERQRKPTHASVSLLQRRRGALRYWASGPTSSTSTLVSLPW